MKNLDNVEEEMMIFVMRIYQSKEYIKQITNVCDVTLRITLYQDTYQYNIRFTKEILGKISELGIDVDVTSMQLQEFYTGQYLHQNMDSN